MNAASGAAKQAKTPLFIGLLGCAAVFASAFCFYFSTVVIRWSREVVSIDSSYFSFFRFLLGFAVVCTIMAQEELAFTLGAAACLRKPVTQAQFLEALDRQVGPRAPGSR